MKFLIFCLMIPALIWKGYVISYLWYWYMVPLGLMVISIPHAIGLSLIITLLTMNSLSADVDDEDLLVKAITYGYIVPLFSLIAGWIVLLFM